MNDERVQFWALYLSRFAEGFGFITLITLLPYYINELDPSATTVFGLTISAGLVVGLYTTGFTLVQTATVVPLLVPFSPTIGAALSLPGAYPLFGDVSPAFLPLVACSGLLGIADSFREPASMALFADEGSEEGGVASSFGIRELVWRPGSVIAPLLGGWLMYEVSMAAVFFVGGAFALTGVATFLLVLVRFHGTGALTEW